MLDLSCIRRLPTFCAVAGISDCGDHGFKLDGVDESGPIFRNSSGGHDYVLYGQHDDAPDTFAPFDDAIRDADGWKLIQGTGGRPSSWSQPVNVTDSDLTEGQAQQACTTPNCAVDRLFNPMGLPQKGGGVNTFFCGGIYRDQLLRTERGWRITERINDQLYAHGALPAGLQSPK